MPGTVNNTALQFCLTANNEIQERREAATEPSFGASYPYVSHRVMRGNRQTRNIIAVQYTQLLAHIWVDSV